ncbi:MAG TPA: O-methyltransferase [Solirubrobacteraceae bacterium]|nr:O-methyltransferase [Solirubrobacteraceae bacterium]
MIRDHRVQAYLERLRPERDPLLAEMEALARLERIPIVEWETGRLLATLVRALRPRRVLEVGTAIGCSTLHMARELDPGARIVTLERNPKRIAQARGYWDRGGVLDRIDLVEGDALESIATLGGAFDLVFLDATKTEIDAYLAALRGRVADRCLLVVDNLLMSGEVALPEGLDTAWSDEALAAARRTTRALMESDEWLFSLLPVGDGVGLGARRDTVSP